MFINRMFGCIFFSLRMNRPALYHRELTAQSARTGPSVAGEGESVGFGVREDGVSLAHAGTQGADDFARPVPFILDDRDDRHRDADAGEDCFGRLLLRPAAIDDDGGRVLPLRVAEPAREDL